MPGDNQATTDRAAVVDINGARPAVAETTPMRYARNWLNLTVLPDGEVFGNGGTRVGTQAGAANSMYTSEIWNPVTGKWRNGTTAKRIRTYHSTSLLLPGGSVLTAAGGLPGPEDNFNAEIYYPPYLFTKGTDGRVRWADRPQITSIGGSVAYGGTVALGLSDNRRLASMSLIRAAGVTHSYSTDQRRLPLSFSQSGQTVNAKLPAKRQPATTRLVPAVRCGHQRRTHAGPAGHDQTLRRGHRHPVRQGPHGGGPDRPDHPGTQARDKAGNTTVLQRPLYGKVAATDKKAGYSFKPNPKKHGKKFTVQLRAYDYAGNVVTSAKRTYRR